MLWATLAAAAAVLSLASRPPLALARPAARPGARPAPGQDSLPGALSATPLAGGGTLVSYRLPAQELVAIRLSFAIPREGGQGEALGRMVQGLVQPEMERRAAFWGARVALERSATHLGFSIVGPSSVAGELGAILREGLARTDWDTGQVETARLVAWTQAREEAETPEPLLRRRLAARLFPALPESLETVPASVSPATLRRFWLRTFAPGRLRAVVVGPLSAAQAAAALGHWAAPVSASGKERDSASLAPARRPRGGRRAPPPAAGAGPQVVFAWAAAGWRSDADPAALAVSARLVQARLAESGRLLRVGRAELWWSTAGRALVVLGSAATDSTAAGMAAQLAAAVRDAAAGVTEAEVAGARRAVARDILFAGRTPEGLARYLGAMFERTGEPLAGQGFLRALDAVDAPAVRAVLDGLGDGPTLEMDP